MAKTQSNTAVTIEQVKYVLDQFLADGDVVASHHGADYCYVCSQEKVDRSESFRVSPASMVEDYGCGWLNTLAWSLNMPAEEIAAIIVLPGEHDDLVRLDRVDRTVAHLMEDFIGSLNRPMSVAMVTVCCNQFMCAASEIQFDIPEYIHRDQICTAYKNASYAKMQLMAFIASVQSEIKSRDLLNIFIYIRVVKDGELVFEPTSSSHYGW